jgi:phenylacetate-CoA ligase
MSWYEPVFRRVLFPLYEAGLRRRKTLTYLKEYEANARLAPDQIAALQWSKLQRLIAHCWAEVPYYQRRWREVGATPQDIRSLDDYARLPLLTKQDIRTHFEELHAPSYRDRMLYKTTGGSTGEPMRFGYTRESYERRVSVMWRGYGFAGARMGQRTLYLWGMAIDAPARAQLKDRLYHAAFNRCMLNAFTMSEPLMPQYADTLDRFKPEIIVAYVGPLLRLAEWLIANGRQPHRPKAILGAAEALHDAQRKVIERAFGCPVYNTYGCREFMLIATECEHRDGLHMNADHLAIEVDAAQPTPNGERLGDIVVTDLHNYVNGDLAVAGDARCACGRGLPLLRRIEGRRLDTLRTPAGHLLPGEYVVYAFLYVVGIKRYQVVQRELHALDVNLVRDAEFSAATEQRIRYELGKVVGDSVALRLHYVDDIAPSRSGKFRVTVSELP